jgi:ribonuclease J
MGMPAQNVLVVENGYILEFTAKHATVGERVPGGYVFVDGAGVGDVGPSLLRERDQLARDGFVVVTICLGKDGQPRAHPQVVTRGFVFEPQAADLLAGISQRVNEILEQEEMAEGKDLQSILRLELEEYLYQETKRRPMVIPTLSCNYLS